MNLNNRSGFLLLLQLILFFSLAACSSLPSKQDMQKAIVGFKPPVGPGKGEAIVYILRPGTFGGLIKFNVFLDNEMPNYEMGYTRGNQYIYFFVKPGEHTIYSNAENTAEIQINPKEGEYVFIKQEPSMGFLFARNSLHKIGKTEGLYHLKQNVSVGTIKSRKLSSQDEVKPIE